MLGVNTRTDYKKLKRLMVLDGMGDGKEVSFSRSPPGCTS